MSETNELAARLARRRKINEGEEVAPTENISTVVNENNEKPTTDNADNELAMKLQRFMFYVNIILKFLIKAIEGKTVFC